MKNRVIVPNDDHLEKFGYFCRIIVHETLGLVRLWIYNERDEKINEKIVKPELLGFLYHQLVLAGYDVMLEDNTTDPDSKAIIGISSERTEILKSEYAITKKE